MLQRVKIKRVDMNKMYVKKYDQWVLESLINSETDKKTLDYIEDSITESEFLLYLEEEINESLTANLVSKARTKVINVLGTFLEKSKDLGFKIVDKLKTFLDWIVNTIVKFKERYPLLYKIAMISVITIVLILISTSVVRAGISGTPIPVDKIDMAIGLLEKLRFEGTINMFDGAKAITHLIDIRDGNVDIPEIGSNAIKMADAALNTVERMQSDATNSADETLLKACYELLEKGRTVLGSNFMKTGSTERISLIYK